MKTPLSPIDPLDAKGKQSSTAFQAAIKREIDNILTSYVGWFDPFAELIQNSLDSVEERARIRQEDYQPELRIRVDLKHNSLTVSDNGTGLSEEKYRQFLAPNFSFKSGRTRGHKGVGATFLAYGYNFIQITTKTPDYEHCGKMEGARDWLTDVSPPSNPLIVHDKSGCLDSGFKEFDRGVSITVRFDPTTVPGDLGWIKAETPEVWRDLLLIKTGLGAVLQPLSVIVHLEVCPKTGSPKTLVIERPEYKWPHTIPSKSKKLRDAETKSAALHKRHGKNYQMPAAFRNLDCLYDVYNHDELGQFVQLTQDEASIVKKYRPTVYLAYMYTARVWADYNDSLQIRANHEILKPGIQIAANNMPQGEIIQIPLKRNIGRQNQVHFLAHFEDCKADLGRKGFQKEIVSFCEEVSRKLIEGPFQRHKHCLRPTTGVKTDLKRESDLDEWKSEMVDHEKQSPLVLSNPNFFLPVKQIGITSVPTREQDVISLFNQLVAGGVIRGINIMSTNERFTYDGMYRIVFPPPVENHIHHPTKNPLGILKTACQSDGFRSQPKILEYKFSLDGLIEDFENGEKNPKDVGLVIVWETGESYQQNYTILSLLNSDNINERQYHGVTHIVQNVQTLGREMDLIVLSELIEFLNNPVSASRKQKKKYED